MMTTIERKEIRIAGEEKTGGEDEDEDNGVDRGRHSGRGRRGCDGDEWLYDTSFLQNLPQVEIDGRLLGLFPSAGTIKPRGRRRARRRPQGENVQARDADHQQALRGALEDYITITPADADRSEGQLWSRRGALSGAEF